MSLILDGTAGLTFNNALTQELVQSLFEYKDGQLFRKVNRRSFKAGDLIGAIEANGYVRTTLNGKRYLIHRIVYLMHHGYMPKEIDHINGNKSDNRIENLREVSRSENNLNRGNFKNNKSGCKNVSWHKLISKWQVQIKLNKKTKHFGYFKDIELADLVATEAKDKYYGKFANHGVTL
jgi:hypothetical protein